MKYHLETREILAAAYLGPNKGRTMLTHAVMADETGQATRVICGRVMLGSIADRDRGRNGPDGEPIWTSQPTCRTCRVKTRGMTFGAERNLMKVIQAAVTPFAEKPKQG